MDKWIRDLQSATSAIESANQAIQDIYTWVDRNVVPTDVIPRRFPLELDQSFQILGESLRNAATRIASIHDTIMSGACMVLRGQRLSREQFHLISALKDQLPLIGALDLLNYTNKYAGLSEYDDYEVFQHFYYESAEKHGYITPGMMPLLPLVTIGNTTTISARASIAASLPPEDILWDSLKLEQRLFFERYLPNVAVRFRRQT